MRNGLTLIEIMVVVVILGIIAAIVAANIGDKPDIVAVRLTEADLRKLKGEVELFKADYLRYPDSLQDLVHRPSWVEAKHWHEYRDEMPVDGWKRPYRYRVPGTRGRFDIVSLGADGLEGGEGVNADLWSHPAK
jgi:general secretion pathway protein G